MNKCRKRGREKFAKYKWVFNILVKFYSFFPMNIRIKMFEKKRYTKGYLGMGVRYALLKAIAKQCGDNVSIFQGCFILHPENLLLGDNISIQPQSYIDADGGISIGNNVSIAHGATLISSSHNYFDINIPTKDQGLTLASIEICENVWIGAKATILAGKKINSGAIIGAGAVVTHDVEKNCIAVGVPAKIIKVRK